jgi:tetratricopeptide (TPR) repeat protein
MSWFVAAILASNVVGIWGDCSAAQVSSDLKVEPRTRRDVAQRRHAEQAPSSGTVSAVTQPITFTKHVAPIIFDRCAPCHRPGGAAPFSLMTYSEVHPRARQIAAVTKSRYMPPWKSEPAYGEFIGQQPLTEAEIETFERWVEAGAPEGAPQDLPPAPNWSESWQLGTPDLVLTSSQPYTLQADGTDVFRVFVIPIPIKFRRYVKGVEFRPHNRRVTHHATIMLDRTPTSRQRNDEDPSLGEKGLLSRTAGFPSGYMLGWTPGQPDPLLPYGLAWPLEPGTDLVVQLHLKPSGKPETVGFAVAFFFGTSPPQRSPALLRLGRQDIDIPPRIGHHVVVDSYTLPVDVSVLALKPHAHYRAREIRSFATLPDKTVKWLLYIKDWDFNWQNMYRYVEPVLLPRNTILTFQITYDNSAENARNPQSPPERARWGPRSSDEMGDLWIQVLPNDDRDLPVLNESVQKKMVAEDVIGYEVLTGMDPDNAIAHDDVAMLYLELGEPEKAVRHLEAVARLKAGSASAYNNLGVALEQSGSFEEAMSQYRKALEIDPDLTLAHYNLGNLLESLARVDEALVHFREAVRSDPSHAGSHNNIGLILMRQGKPDEALRSFRDALRADPDLPEAHYNTGMALQQRGDLVEAVDHLRDALRLQPDWIQVMGRLAWILATTSRDGLDDAYEAVRLASRAVALTGRQDARLLDTLATAYAAATEFEQALKVVDEALRLDPPPDIAAGLLERRALYGKRQPYRNPGVGR